MRFLNCLSLLALAALALSCDSCYGPRDDSIHVRNVKRMQPGVPNATALPRGPLAWGQLNFLHTTDTHGWLEGHLKEANYGADWGDFVSFSRHFQHMAGNLGVDLLLIDTGDLHDGDGISDATDPDGIDALPIFNNLNFDLLTIGNHELYLANVATLTFQAFASYWGEKYLTSNVDIFNPSTNTFEPIGRQYRYFTTQYGLRIMAFGVTPAKTMVKQQWFLNAVNTPEPVDIFLVLGHNPARPGESGSTFGTIYSAIRALRPDTPIQFFGGHTHIRDFAVLDEGTTSIESGRYCETFGWVSMSGIKSDNYTGNVYPRGVPNPTQKAIAVSAKATPTATPSAFADLVYSRRYVDWNRLSMSTALQATVINASRSTTPRLIIINSGSIRFDLIEGPFTYDDSFIVSPFTDEFQFIPDVPYSMASTVLGALNGQPSDKKRDLQTRDFGFTQGGDSCVDAVADNFGAMQSKLTPRSTPMTRGKHRRQTTSLTPGYTTSDDFGTDGDDTIHSEIPYYSQPDYVQANGSLPTTGTPATVDLVFLDFIASDVLEALTAAGGKYTTADILYYVPQTFTVQSYLPAYAQLAWQANVPNCPIAVNYP
ncbi:MAG: hypothetical protein MMC33_008997 [Icmadophila ericetorum]|nr:hypothetical protein [Icmadophila ericetorum]